jgi:hypothetical protein
MQNKREKAGAREVSPAKSCLPSHACCPMFLPSSVIDDTQLSIFQVLTYHLGITSEAVIQRMAKVTSARPPVTPTYPPASLYVGDSKP